MKMEELERKTRSVLEVIHEIDGELNELLLEVIQARKKGNEKIRKKAERKLKRIEPAILLLKDYLAEDD
jgi:hypothetical protein